MRRIQIALLSPQPSLRFCLVEPGPRRGPPRCQRCRRPGAPFVRPSTPRDARGGGTFVVWVPAGHGRPSVSGHNIQTAEVIAVDGVFLVTVAVCGPYTVTISSATAPEPPVRTAPALVTPAFTG